MNWHKTFSSPSISPFHSEMYVRVIINIFINTFEFNEKLREECFKNLILLKTFVPRKVKENLHSSVSENTAHL